MFTRRDEEGLAEFFSRMSTKITSDIHHPSNRWWNTMETENSKHTAIDHYDRLKFVSLVQMKCGDLGMMPFDIAEVEMIRLSLIIPRHSKTHIDDQHAKQNRIINYSPIRFHQTLDSIGEIQYHFDLCPLRHFT